MEEVVVRIAMGLDTNGSLDATLERARRWRDLGFTSQWSSQIFGPDTLTVLAVVGHELRDLDLGTAVVPVQPRHPTMLAAQARTVADAIGGRFTLGVGLSHQVIVEGMWGLSFERPVSFLEEYLAVLAPTLRGEPVRVEGERLR
ncbi:luciferase family protein, partial [mine drainage metagenome]